MRFRRISILLLLAVVGVGVWPGVGASQDQPSTDGTPEMTVAIKAAEPFVILDTDGPTGYSIDLWEDLADRLDIDYRYEVVETVGDQLRAVESGSADAAIAAISITHEREEVLDFTHPIYLSGQQVLIDESDGALGEGVLGHLLSSGLFKLVLLLLAATIGMGLILWLIERRHNPHFGGDESHGALDGIWWSVVTLTTVGYGDKVPSTPAGRILTMVWILSGVVFLALFTAAVTTSLTVEELGTDINGIDDLYGREVLAIEGTTSEMALSDRHITYDTAPDLDTGAAQLADGDVDALVYDAPLLQYYVATGGRGSVRIAGDVFDSEIYAIALPHASPYRERLNVALTEMGSDGAARLLAERWFERGG